MTLCHNVQTATLLINFGFGHVLQHTPFILNFSALHFTHSYPAKEGVPKFCVSTHPHDTSDYFPLLTPISIIFPTEKL